MNDAVAANAGEEPDEAKILGVMMAAMCDRLKYAFVKAVLNELNPDLFFRREAIVLAAIMKDSVEEKEDWTVKDLEGRVKESADEWDLRLPKFVMEAREAAVAVSVLRIEEEIRRGLEAVCCRRDREGWKE